MARCSGAPARRDAAHGARAASAFLAAPTPARAQALELANTREMNPPHPHYSRPEAAQRTREQA
eukprot:4013914-Pyramimonas_sp.AAC.1